MAMPQAVPQIGLPRVLRRSPPRWQVWPHCHMLVSRESAMRVFLTAAGLEQHFDNFKALGVDKMSSSILWSIMTITTATVLVPKCKLLA